MLTQEDKKVLLVRPLANRKAAQTLGLDIPLGITALAGYLEAESIEVQVLDLQTVAHPYQKLETILRAFRPLVAGITAFSLDVKSAHEAAKLIKQCAQGVYTVLGGVGPSALPLPIMENFRVFDYLIYGEGEETLFELIHNLSSARHPLNTPGVVWRKGEEIMVNPPRPRIRDLDTLPFLAFHKLELKRYSPNYSNYLHKNFVALATQRGCPYNCSFCGSGAVWGKQVYHQSSRRIVDEISHLVKTLRVRDVHFYDEMFTLHRERLMGLCELLLKKKIKISWNCSSRVDTIDLPMLKQMKKAGCYQIKYGLETGSQNRLNLINKGFRLEQAKEAINLTKKAGIETLTTFILGLPQETEADCRQTINFARKLNPDIAVFNIFQPMPGSRIFQQIGEQGIDWKHYFEHPWYVSELMPDKKIDTRTLEGLTRQAHISYYLSPAWFFQYLRNVMHRPVRLLRIFNGLKYLFLRILHVYY